ncbi:response regulator [Phenylobacterium sp.]|uniref:response regulator transcription factor n=1 Tax=Phenylobacterium sp. TaxID=1871053 RepID=UPI00301C4598
MLIIDDDPALLRLMSMAFDRAGFATVSADNGRAGVAMARTHRPDLVVTDIVMPDVEGIGAIRAIKQAARPPKVVAISGAGRTRGADYLSWARHLGADAVLAKPFRMAELVRVSQGVIQGSLIQGSLQGPSPASHAIDSHTDTGDTASCIS